MHKCIIKRSQIDRALDTVTAWSVERHVGVLEYVYVLGEVLVQCASASPTISVDCIVKRELHITMLYGYILPGSTIRKVQGPSYQQFRHPK